MNYYKQGDAANADKIKAAFENKGYSDKGFTFDVNDILFFTANNKHINVCPANGWLANIIKTHPDYKELELPIEPDYQELELPIEPCFKVGDKIEATIYGIKRRVTIREVDKTNRCYFGTLEECIGFSEQDQWHLVPKPHYDIANFKPFDKVLARDTENEKWVASLFSNFEYGAFPHKFVCIDTCYTQCIPFEGNEHLLGTTDMPSEEYINW